MKRGDERMKVQWTPEDVALIASEVARELSKTLPKLLQANEMSPDTVVDMAWVAQRLRRTPKTVRNMCISGRFPMPKRSAGQRWRWLYGDVKDYLS